MIRENGKLQDSLPEEFSQADPEKIRKEWAATAIGSYGHILLGMAKRRHPEWDVDQINRLEHACQTVFSGLSAACSEGSLCVTVAKILEQNAALLPEVLKNDINLLLENDLLSKDGKAGIPVIFDEDESDLQASRFYFQRYWNSEKTLAEKLVALSFPKPAGSASQRKRDELLAQLEHIASVKSGGQLSPMLAQSNADRRQAITQAMENNFTIISGGPGTGKTTAVASVLECLLASDSQLKIALAAPTGKAAGRLLESIERAIQENAELYGLLRQKQSELVAHTLHKWLWDPQSNGERPSAKSPFEYDVLVIDEASMIDVELAVQVFSIIDSKKTRVIMLGDPYQLAAVGPGSVLADLCDAQCPLKGNVATLTVSHRFPADSPLGRLSIQINNGIEPEDESNPLETVVGEIQSELSNRPLGWRDSLSKSAQDWIDAFIEKYAKAIVGYRSDKDGENTQKKQLWETVKQFQALAALRNGPMSVKAVNDYAEQRLRWYLYNRKRHAMSGRLIIVRKNDNDLEIYNGDVGVILPQFDDNQDVPFVYFGDRNGKILPLGKLPEYQPAFGITIHQSQGSEYENVAVFLPDDDENPLVTRELLYTAVTRVKTFEKDGVKHGTLTVFGNTKAYNTALRRRTERMGGLNVRLSEALRNQAS